MVGDKLMISSHHTDRAAEFVTALKNKLSFTNRLTCAVCGESGSGKSELASEIARLSQLAGYPSAILQQDDYFVYPPLMNAEMRRVNINQVGRYEVKLDFLDSALRAYRRGETLLYKPLILFDENRIITEEMNVEDVRLLIAEGTYTGFLTFTDIKVFIDRDYRETRQSRLKRGREEQDVFLEEVLKKEHEIIRNQKFSTDWIVSSDFKTLLKSTIAVRQKPTDGDIPQGGTI